MTRLVLAALLLFFDIVVALNATQLDCDMRKIALGYAKYLQAWRPANDPVFRQVHDALQLDDICNHVYPHEKRKQESSIKRRLLFNDPPPACTTTHCLYVDANATTGTGDGSVEKPVNTLADALVLSRSIGASYNTTILLRTGIHSLNGKTIKLGRNDSGLHITGYPGAWISGGIEIPSDTKWRWDCSHNLNIRVANLTDLLSGHVLPKIASLFSLDKRLIRARYPNSDPEVAQWGYASKHKLEYSIPANEVVEWHRPPKGQVPNFTYVDLRYHNPPKNDSTQDDYNVYASGQGGVCADLWGPEADSYWCSNASSGGWAEVDKECATTGQLQIPVGMTYNRSSDIGKRLDLWGGSALGGIVYAWHSQSWAMHMFMVKASSPGKLHFAKGGGRQGGRNWCRCDQCTYAGGWCGQHQDPPFEDKRLIGGTWLVENVKSELDRPGEFFFDPATNLLYLYPNATKATNTTGLENLRLALLERIIEIEGANDIHITNLGFRDAAATFMSDWSAPSGGDWALHRGGAVFVEGSSNVTIEGCTFRRLDGSAIFLSRRTRGIIIRRSVFEWLGENAIATWGDAKGFDATNEDQPIGTVIEHNVMRELGIFQKQSSGVGHNKAAKTTITSNIMFNMPRAAINFNDGLGGGDLVERNLIFNTCRESGDHGPINSWDRQPFLTKLRNGTASFVPLNRTITRNFIVANYGASQGVDNDDGSSWYHIKSNVFYTAEGFKMDYGGHDSLFEDNLVMSYPDKKGKCVGFGGFFPGHGHIVRGNTCLVSRSDDAIIYLSKCNGSNAILHNNFYFTPNGSATVECGDQNSLLSFHQIQEIFGLEHKSSVQRTPKTTTQVVAWVTRTLFHDEHSALSDAQDEASETAKLFNIADGSLMDFYYRI